MAKPILLSLVVLVDAIVVLAMASDHISPSPTRPPITDKSFPTNRKLGPHQTVENGGSPRVQDLSPSPTSSEHAPVKSTSSEASNLQSSTKKEDEVVHSKKNHGSMDKSVAGGGVILGGLAMVFLGAVFCYIRATGRQKQTPVSSVG